MMARTITTVIATTALVCWGTVSVWAQQAPQSPNMTFFVTSAGPGKGADLGGLEGATGCVRHWR